MTGFRLIIIVAILFVVGLAGGLYLRGEGFSSISMEAEYNDESAEKKQKHYRDQIFGDRRTQWRMLRKEQQKLLEILTAETFDSQAFQAQSDHILAKRQQLLHAMHQTIHDQALTLDHAGRSDLAESLHPRRPKKHRNSP